jgi:NADPH-dependent 2,4-dienoyl-CoA reductase/sulfur reductase-like enzyme
MRDDGVVIVGGGLASQRCLETLRARGYGGRLAMVCGEAELPYDRPPLSKGLLAGELEESEVGFRPARWYADQLVELTFHRAVALDTRRRRLRLDDGREPAYGDLVIATGSAPRVLPQLKRYTNVHYLRTIADARRLRTELREGVRLTIVGAGFIGQEIASTARAAGAEVTLVEALPAPLGPVLGERIGRALMKMHSDEGVDVRLSTKLEGARGNGTVEELQLSRGDRLECDLVVVGIGVAPEASWLEGSGLGSDGVVTDTAGRTGVPHVFAAGDVTTAFDHRVGRQRRSEHWDAAARQGVAVAQAILGERPDPAAPPSFWSDQYGVRIQYFGHAETADEMTVEGRPDERRFAVVYTRGGRPVAALTVDDPRAFARLRREIERNYSRKSDERSNDELHTEGRPRRLQRAR